MRPGPKPVPQALHTAAAGPPDLLAISPDPPEWMSKEAATEWWSLCQLLIDRQQLTRGDLGTVENLIRLRGLLPTLTSTREINTTISTITKLSRELGLTPSSRHKVAAVASNEVEVEDDLERFKRDCNNELQPWQPARLRDSD